MRLTISHLRRIIKEEVERSLNEGIGGNVATVTVDEMGRYISFGGKQINVIDAAYDSGADPDDDEEYFDHVARRIEDRFYKKNGITHVISFEDFGDRLPHPVSGLILM